MHYGSSMQIAMTKQKGQGGMSPFRVTILAFVWLHASVACAHPPSAHGVQVPRPANPAVSTAEASTPLAIAEAFAAALAGGDASAALSVLAEDVLIYESGGQESSRQEYASHHLKSDMEFLSEMAVQILERKVGPAGELAWVATRSRITGTYHGKSVDLYSTESLLMSRATGRWQIVHIHWSSMTATPDA